MKKIEEYTRGWNAALKATAEFANRNLNQSVSQPEDTRTTTITPGYGSVTVNTDSMTINPTATTLEVENNTEECKHKYILESRYMGLLRIRCPLCGDTRDIRAIKNRIVNVKDVLSR